MVRIEKRPHCLFCVTVCRHSVFDISPVYLTRGISGLAGLLRDCKYEDDNAKMGQMVEKKIPLLYLETVETPQNESEEPCKAGNAPVAGL